MNRHRWWAVGLAALVSLVAVGLWLLSLARDLATLDAAREAVAQRRFEEARGRLDDLTLRHPDWVEAAYLLGETAQALAQPEEALAAYLRVPKAGTPWSDRASLARALLLFDHQGSYRVAETTLEELAVRHRADALGAEVRMWLARLYRYEGRDADARRLLAAGYLHDRIPAATLRELWKIEIEGLPLDAVRTLLDKAEARSPLDDRVRLGQAVLAMRAGDFEEARRRLEACRREQPHDPAVWRSWLSWAITSGNVAEAVRAARELPASAVASSDVPRLTAWLAAQAGDPLAERQALEELVQDDPGVSLERLADLAVQAGRVDEARELRRRKTAFDAARERYRALLETVPRADDFAELANLAEILGRRVEARGWLTLVLRNRPGDAALRARLQSLAPDRATVDPKRTLADLVPPALLAVGGRDEEPAAVETSTLDFHDEAEARGLRFVYDHGPSPARQLPETMSGGVGLLDYDGDGWLDIYAIQGGTFPPAPGAANADRLFHNKGDGTFEDVTVRAGLAGFPGGYGLGVTVGDVDNDGHPDLFLTRWRSYALYRNKGDGSFEDVTLRWGLGGDRDWPTSAAFADLDGDGDLDLYVCHYLDWDAAHPQICLRHQGGDERQYCDPRKFPSLPDHMFRNDGGRFVDVTDESGIVDRDGRGLGVVAADLDDDGRVDLYVANDTTANFAFHNLGGFKFEEVGHEIGLAGNAEGGYQASMGIACGDLDGDGRVDLAVTNFYGEGTTFYHNLGSGMFADRSASLNLLTLTRLVLGFGLAFLDVDHDGRLDVVQANGHVNDYAPYVPYHMPAQLLLGRDEGRLIDVSRSTGPAWKLPRLGRGLAVGDLDNDGRLEIVMVDQGKPLVLFRNRARPRGGSLMLHLEGTRSNRDAVGARVTVRTAGRARTAWRIGGGSFQAASDGRIHVGLGDASAAEQVEILWPSGRLDRFQNLSADTIHHLREGVSTPKN